MKIQEKVSLRPYNTFGLEVNAARFVEVSSLAELRELILDPALKSLPKFILGGGSNILFTQDFNGLIIRNRIRGIEITNESEEYARVKAGAGEVWHSFVLWTLDHNLAGLENLSLIPGSVGAAPIQNIGAYGVEIKDTFYELEAMSLEDGSLTTFSREECKFGYRDSIFKREAKNKFVIVSVTFQLSKKPALNTSYGAIEQELKAMNVQNAGIREISQAVINIRSSKLPDPAKIGNAGSFFKNPEVEISIFEKLKSEYPDLVGYKTGNNKMKLAAGWLIEQCGWKGKVSGHVGMHKQQALVLVNYGGATGSELIQHARTVQSSVREKFGVELEMEVNIL
ncbi:MAG: UDP-N-acetylmuramate dehydrogenase [Bacteroidetes bacterium]|nr:UDP-N-acetylmuramate dehydrogenase [Bacteroidota bacterium]